MVHSSVIKRLKGRLVDLHFRELLLGSSSSLVLRVVGMGLGYLTMLHITNHHGAEVFGVLSLLTTVVLIFSIVPKFGMDIALVRIIGELRAHAQDLEIKYVIKKVVLFVFFASCAFSIFLFFSSGLISKYFFNKPHIYDALQVMSITVVANAVIVAIAAVFQGVKRIKTFVFLQLVVQHLLFLILLLMNDWLYFGAQIITVYVLSSILSATVALTLLVRTFDMLHMDSVQERHKYNLKKILISSYPMLITGSFAVMMGWIDIIMLGIFQTEVDVGIYTVAHKIAGLVGLSLVVVNSISLPKFAECYAKKDLSRLRDVARQSTALIFITSAPLFLLSVFAADFIMSIFGKEFIAGSLALILMATAQLFNAFCGPVGSLLQMTDHQKIVQKIVALVAIVNLVLNYFLIPVYGINGAALSTMLSVILWNAIMIFVVKNSLGFWAFYIPKFNR